MVHGDNKGLVLPSRVAPLQVVVVTIPNSKLSAEDAKKLNGAYPPSNTFLTAIHPRVVRLIPPHRSWSFVSLGSAS